jgi:hypothetical protein
LLTCASLNGLKDGAKDVGVVVTPLVLDDGDQALQSHAAVDVFTNKFLKVISLEILREKIQGG